MIKCNELLAKFINTFENGLLVTQSDLRDNNWSMFYDRKHIKKQNISRFVSNLKTGLRWAFNIPTPIRDAPRRDIPRRDITNRFFDPQRKTPNTRIINDHQFVSNQPRYPVASRTHKEQEWPSNNPFNFIPLNAAVRNDPRPIMQNNSNNHTNTIDYMEMKQNLLSRISEAIRNI